MKDNAMRTFCAFLPGVLISFYLGLPGQLVWGKYITALPSPITEHDMHMGQKTRRISNTLAPRHQRCASSFMDTWRRFTGVGTVCPSSVLKSRTGSNKRSPNMRRSSRFSIGYNIFSFQVLKRLFKDLIWLKPKRSHDLMEECLLHIPVFAAVDDYGNPFLHAEELVESISTRMYDGSETSRSEPNGTDNKHMILQRAYLFFDCEDAERYVRELCRGAGRANARVAILSLGRIWRAWKENLRTRLGLTKNSRSNLYQFQWTFVAPQESTNGTTLIQPSRRNALFPVYYVDDLNIKMKGLSVQSYFFSKRDLLDALKRVPSDCTILKPVIKVGDFLEFLEREAISECAASSNNSKAIFVAFSKSQSYTRAAAFFGTGKAVLDAPATW